MDKFDAAMAVLMDGVKAQSSMINALQVAMGALAACHPEPARVLAKFDQLSRMDEARLLADTTSSDAHVEDRLHALELVRSELASALELHAPGKVDQEQP